MISTLAIITNILAISIPLLIAYATYKLSTMEGADHVAKKRYHKMTYFSSIVLILLTIGNWVLNQEENKETLKENKELSKDNKDLLTENKKLLHDGKDLYRDQKDLYQENLKISNENKGLSIKVDELKQILTQKDEKISILEKQVKNIELSSPKIDNQGRIASSPYVTMASEFSDGISESRELFNRGDLKGSFKKAEELINKKNDFGLAYFIKGTILFKWGRYSEAILDFNKAIKYGLDKSDLTWCYHNMAINELHRNNREEAYKFFIKCYNISPDFNESKDIFETLKKEIKK
jgi:tetratricopeptide (TPR) repeat protein